MKQIILVRHGEVEEAFAGKFVGSSDAELSQLGVAQMRAWRPYFQNFLSAVFFTSPYKRAVNSMSLATGLKVVPESVRDDLREIDFGAWEGKSSKQVQEGWPGEYNEWLNFDVNFKYPDGESHRAFLSRIHKRMDIIKQLPGKTAILFTHGGVIRFLICHLLGMDVSHYRVFRTDRATVSIVDVSGDRGVLETINLKVPV
jgi:alpha-ribazole phosphatase